MCLRAALLSAPIMSHHVAPVSDHTLCSVCFYTSRTFAVPTPAPQPPGPAAPPMNLLSCSFSQLLTVSAAGLQLPVCSASSLTRSRADWDGGSVSADVRSYSAFWTQVTVDVVYLQARQPAARRGPARCSPVKLRLVKQGPFIFIAFSV